MPELIASNFGEGEVVETLRCALTPEAAHILAKVEITDGVVAATIMEVGEGGR
ncbi:MAG: hypothetical protein GDA52_06375 [Rhodobacteraceae bacterium]|nr:hypothetical protein [Paracoccaceae bacterium]